MQVRYTRRSLADLDEVFAFISRDDPRAARAMLDRIRVAIEGLQTFPESGRRGRVAGTRELVVHGTPFLVAYRVTAATIDVLAVLHASRRWPSSFG